MNKKEWIQKHGVINHNKKFTELRYNWTPVKCKCKIACILNVDDYYFNTKRNRKK